MSERDVPLTCDAVDEWLPDHLEGTLDAGSATRAAAHLAACRRCATLLGELEGIRHDARALPDLVPSRDLWAGISARIDTPVLPLAAVRAAARRPPGVVIPRAWLGAMAAGLVATTAGVTYMATVRHLDGRQPLIAMTTDRGTADPRRSTAPISGDSATLAMGSAPNDPSSGVTPRTSALADPAASAVDRIAGEPTESRDAGARPANGTALASRPGSATATYDREIESLHTILRDRSGQLDPRTVAILESNVRMIDQAIVESRAALARDPASRFLRDQLVRALDQKLELLRTAALLRSRT